ncbi:trichohyalin-like isoform X1 [Symsagittifera roscoffensis]|uniref:trichohyalin-like isoform X1 n=1 Tax=Symsagittifera roscoffensis TaxID=84072 RepID=UPI00307C19C5
MADDLEEFIQAQKAKLAQARRSHGIKQPQQVQFHQSENAGLREIAVPGTSQNTVQPISSVKDYTESGVNFGDYENKKRLYQEERKAETRSFLAKDRQRKPVDRSNIAPEAGLHIRDTQSDKKQKEIERNREYNQFLAANPKNNPKSRKPEETGPGNQNSYFPDPDRNHENKLRNERNREYNEYLRQRDEQERLKKNQQQQGSQPQQRYQPAPVAAPVPPVAMPIPVAYPGAGGAAYAYYGPPVAAAAAVPDYNELLRQKMELEQKYRQSNGLPTSPSAAYYNQQKSPQTGGDGGGYQPRSQGAPRRTLPPVDDLEARMQTYDFELGKRKQILKDDSSNSHQYAQSRAVINDPSNMMDPGRYMGGDTFLDDRLMSQFGRRGDDPSLRLDNLPTSSAPQMQQPAPNRFVGGQGGFSGGGMGGPLTAPGGPPDPNMEKRRKQQEYKQQLEAQMSASAMAKRIEKEKNLQINLTGEKNPSKFPSEFMRNVGVARDPQVNMARHAQSMPPPASHGPLLDKPLDMWATGVSGGMGGLGPTAYDPNYQYYATADPLDPMMVPNSLGGMDMSNMHQQVSSGGNNYQADLLNQMREKQDRQYRNKMEQERWERKKDAEEQYFPFGKGGGGAPLKDADGKIIADLRELHHIAETSKQPNVNHNYHGQLTEVTSSRPNDFGGGVSARDPTAPQHARGRVFNDAPVSKQQFSQQEQYKLDLKRQIEERNRVKEEERKRQADEDAREEQKIKAQMAQIQAEYDKEQEKIRKKAEEQQKKNDELRVAAEEKRLAVDRARKEEEEKQADERRREMERELEERRRQQQQHDKPKSPPVPAQQQQQQNTAPPPSNRAPPPTVQPKPAPPTEPVSPDMPPSHPVRLTKNKTNPERDASRAEVNRQLSAMRKQLLSEQRRIEMQIDNKNGFNAWGQTGSSVVQYPLDLTSIDAELFRRELETEKHEKSMNTGGREFPIVQSRPATQLPPINPAYRTESTSSSIEDNTSKPLTEPLRASTSNGRPKNSNHSSSNTPAAPVTPLRSTTPRRRGSAGKRGRLFSRSSSLPPTAVPVDSEMMPHILEEFDLSPKTTKSTTSTGVNTMPMTSNGTEGGTAQAQQVSETKESDRPSESEFQTDLLNPEDVNRPDSETLTPPDENEAKPESSNENKTKPETANENKTKPETANENENKNETTESSTEKEPPPPYKLEVTQTSTDNLSRQETTEQENRADLNESSTQSREKERSFPKEESQTEIDQIFSGETQPQNSEDRNASATNTVEENTIIIRENSEQRNYVENGDENQELDVTRSTILPNMADDATTIPDDDVSEAQTLGDQSENNTDRLENDDANTANASLESPNAFQNYSYSSMNIKEPKKGGILKRNQSNDDQDEANTSQNQEVKFEPDSEVKDLETDVFQPEGVNRNDANLNTSQINDPSTVNGTESIAMGYLAEAQSETDAAKPPGRKRKSVRFFEIIEDDPGRPIELRDFAIPINNKMPPRVKSIAAESNMQVFEDYKGHGPYPDSARLAYIHTKLEDEDFRQNLTVPQSQRVLSGPDSSAMRSSLLIEKPAWTETSKSREAKNEESVSKDKPWLDSFSKKEVQKIEAQFSGKDIVRERPSKPQGEMILTEPAKVRRPAQAESWKPIFKDEPNEAALDLFMHSKYDPLTRSRDNFRQEFPNAPQSSDMLEVQQRELIRQQERELLKLRQVNPEAGLGDIREDDLAFLIDHPDAKSMPLASDSAYIGMNGETLVPTPPLITKMERMRDRRKKEAEKPSTPPTNIANEPKLKDLLPSPPSSAGGLTNHHRNRSANTTNNTLLVSPDVDDVTLPFEPFQAEKSFSKDDYMNKQLPNPDSLSLGSNFSFDVDAVARKNKERLKKLDNSREDDDLSITDPDEVLRKFVDHDLNPKNIRPISRMTNDTEPDWLRPTN